MNNVKEFCVQLTEERQFFLPAGRGDMTHFSGVPAANSWPLL